MPSTVCARWHDGANMGTSSKISIGSPPNRFERAGEWDAVDPTKSRKKAGYLRPCLSQHVPNLVAFYGAATALPTVQDFKMQSYMSAGSLLSNLLSPNSRAMTSNLFRGLTHPDRFTTSRTQYECRSFWIAHARVKSELPTTPGWNRSRA